MIELNNVLIKNILNICSYHCFCYREQFHLITRQIESKIDSWKTNKGIMEIPLNGRILLCIGQNNIYTIMPNSGNVLYNSYNRCIRANIDLRSLVNRSSDLEQLVITSIDLNSLFVRL